MSGAPGRFTYNGNELDDEYGFDLYYYGARYMDPSSGRFITPDPVRDFYNPYSYVGNNPMNRIDPAGMWAFPTEMGVSCTGYGFLNQTDMVAWIVGGMAAFSNINMSQAEKEWRENILGKETSKKTKSSDEMDAIKTKYWYSSGQDQTQYKDPNFIGPVERPDADGYITWAEAKWWWQHGEGEPLYADLGKIDLGSVTTRLFEGPGDHGYFPLLFLKAGDPAGGSLTDGLVYNYIELTLVKDNIVKATSGYDIFDFNELEDHLIRNFFTDIGEIVVGPGTPFRIRLIGTGRITWWLPPNPGPWD